MERSIHLLTNIMKKNIIGLALVLGLYSSGLSAQSRHWQKSTRDLHYTEHNGDFLLVNGKYRFNRALYGTNQASRVEAGDLPEFALYMPGMAGNLQFVLSANGTSKRLIEADKIETRYRPGSMIYRVTDALLGNGHIDIVVLAQADAEGMVIKLEGMNVASDAIVFAVFGGASGSTFSRGGDIGADPESGFYLLPEYCTNNTYKISRNNFELTYLNRKKTEEFVYGTFSNTSRIYLTDAHSLNNLSQLTQNKPGNTPIVYASYKLRKAPVYIRVTKGSMDRSKQTDAVLANEFNKAEKSRQQLTARVKLRTPDRFINNFGETLAVAADGIWETPTFLHGAVAWRMRLNAWRGAYTADALGWHDRAKEHFTSYANSQVLEPAHAKVVMDTALHLARHIEEMGTSMFSSGYISRNPNNNKVAHHYDMNLVFFDQLFTHFDYTGDVDYLKQMWPVLERHMDWEQRNFRRGGLYDAYCAIWASDGLQYSGGGVAHTTAYNYRANRAMAKLAKIIGKDASVYEQEADTIQKAMKSTLWLGDRGYFAEFQDKFGKQLIHDKPGLWTIYHVADAYMLDDFENYQNVQYINNHLPHIPITVKGQEHEGLYTLATTTWQPYTWSVNNVALAENLQGALAYWQAGRNEEAYRLWKSNIIESMYHGISPGNFQQLSHYDAYRSELYRDFADPIGVASRTLTEGLFGFFPRLLDDKVVIKPGFPMSWDFAEIQLPEWSYHYKRADHTIHFDIKTNYADPVAVQMELPVNKTEVKSVKVNGKAVKWQLKEQSINNPVILFETEKATAFAIDIEMGGMEVKALTYTSVHSFTDIFQLDVPAEIQIEDVFDPQSLVEERNGASFYLKQKTHKGTFFVKLHQDNMSWWQAINVELIDPVHTSFSNISGQHTVVIKNVSAENKRVQLIKTDFLRELTLSPGEEVKLELPTQILTRGTNTFTLTCDRSSKKVNYVNWEVANSTAYDMQNLALYYNERIANIFEQKYLSPRPDVPTLQLPWQGIGNWCYPLATAVIDDNGLMNARQDGVVSFLDIPFLIRGNERNVVFTSQWDNYPTSVEIPVQGKANKVYLLVTGSTNPMQSQMVNAKIQVVYQDGSSDILDLINPVNWWPIEQDLLDDNYAFEIPDDRIPHRVKLSTGELYKGGSLRKYSEIKGYTSRAVDGGAATLLDLPLNSDKELKSLKVLTETNDVVVGLIGATLLR